MMVLLRCEPASGAGTYRLSDQNDVLWCNSLIFYEVAVGFFNGFVAAFFGWFPTALTITGVIIRDDAKSPDVK